MTISGQIQGAASGTAVALWEQLPGQTIFHKIAQTTTDSSGAYTLQRSGSTVKTDRAWYVASGGGKSLTIAQVVNAKLTVSAKAHKLSHGRGHKVTLTGKIDPSHSGQRVLLEEKVGAAWRVLAHARLNKASRYALSHRWAQGGVVRLRIALPADPRNAASVSPVATVDLNG